MIPMTAGKLCFICYSRVVNQESFHGTTETDRRHATQTAQVFPYVIINNITITYYCDVQAVGPALHKALLL